MELKYSHTDEIKAILANKADFVQQNGLNYLIPNWQSFAEYYADTEDMIDEWLNDLDTRRIIDEILEVLPENERTKIEQNLKLIDDKVIAKTFEVNECVWGDKVERLYNYNRNKHWYYYRMNQKVFDSQEGDYTKRT